MKGFAYIILAFSISAFWPRSCNSQNESVREPVSVKAVKVEYSESVPAQVFIGKIEPSKSSAITAPYTGKLVKLKVRKGQKVKEGDVLAIIDSPAVKAAYESSQASYEQAADALDRVEKVYSSGSVTEAKLVEIKTSYSKAEAALSASRRAFENCKIKAPYNGIIGDTFAEEGVELSVMEPILQILDINTVEVHASVPENEYSNFSVGEIANVEVTAVGKSIEVILTDKGIEASALSHTYDFTFRIRSDATDIMPGMVCKVLMNGESGRSIMIPSSAVRLDADGRYVWCLDNSGAVEKKHLSLGGFSGDGVVVLAGLKEGDILIVEGGRKVSSGMTNIMVTGI